MTQQDAGLPITPDSIAFFGALHNVEGCVGSDSVRSSPKQMIDSLTGFRFYAAFLVFISHAMYHFNYFGIQSPALLLVLRNLGHLGVSLFYVLSGFVLFVNYPPRADRPLLLKPFYIARLSRIYPVFFLTTLVAMPLEFFSPVKTAFWLPLDQNLTLTQCLTQASYGSFNDVGWSIGIEFFFYLAFPVLTVLFLKPRKALLVGLLLLASILGILYVLPEQNFYAGPHFPFNRLPEFLLGLAGGWFFVGNGPCWPNWGEFFIRHRLVPGVVLTGLAVLLLWTLPVLIEPWGRLKELYYLFYMGPALLFILVLTCCERAHVPLKLFAAPLVVFCGEISYSFYLIHNLIFRYLRHGLLKLLHCDIKTTALLVQLGLCGLVLVLTLVSSVVLYKTVEMPWRQKIRTFLLGSSSSR